MKKYFGLIVICSIFVGCTKEEIKKPVEKPIDFGIDYTGPEYSLKILNEHKVLCISATNDTIILSFENAYALAEETIVFIKQ